MTDSDSDIFLVVSADEKLDWILDSGSTYHLCIDRDVFSTYAECERLIRMVNNMGNRVVSKGIVWFCMIDERSLTLIKVRYVPNL